MPVPPAQVRQLRDALAELLHAKTALDAAGRNGTEVGPGQRRRLLEAIEGHNTLLDGLLRAVDKS